VTILRPIPDMFWKQSPGKRPYLTVKHQQLLDISKIGCIRLVVSVLAEKSISYAKLPPQYSRINTSQAESRAD